MDANAKKVKRLVLKGENLLELSGEKNVHQLSLRARVSAQTAYKYIHSPNEIIALDMKIVVSLLMDGAGLTAKQVLEMKIGELFDLIEDPQN